MVTEDKDPLDYTSIQDIKPYIEAQIHKRSLTSKHIKAIVFTSKEPSSELEQELIDRGIECRRLGKNAYKNFLLQRFGNADSSSSEEY